MLAIMNIGKYSSSGIVPSGSDLFTISANQSLGQTIDFFATDGNTIIGLPYRSNNIYYTSDHGATWSNVSAPYFLAHVYYSNATSKFYALEMGDETTTTLHYGYSTDGYTWTWDTIYTITEHAYHIYGTFIKDVVNKVRFGILKMVPSSPQTAANAGTLYHIGAYTDNTEDQIGASYPLTSTGTAGLTDAYPVLSINSSKTKTALIFQYFLYSNSASYQNRKLVVSEAGVENQNGYSSSTNAYVLVKTFDEFYYSSTSQRGDNLYHTDLYLSPNHKVWGYLFSTGHTSGNYFSQIYGYFRVGNALYFAYKDSNDTTKWYRSVDAQTAVDITPAEAFYKSDMIGKPVTAFVLDNKHFIISMANGYIYLCEAT